MKKYLFWLLLVFTGKTFSQIVYLDTISFEGGLHGITIDPQPGNLWQVGSPSKTIFSRAYSLPNAMVTDTLNPYPAGNLSSFTFYVLPEGPNTLSFWHKYDTDDGHAGGFIEDSIPGYPWTNIVLDTVLRNQFDFYTYAINFYDSTQKITGNIPAFTGTSDWMYSEYHFNLLCVTHPRINLPDTVWLRFNFLSDTLTTTKDGWMIDDIRFQADICSGIQDPETILGISVYPNPSGSNFTISVDRQVNHGYLFIYDLLGNKLFADYFTGEAVIQCDRMKAGIYVVQVTDGHRVWSTRLIKE